MALTIEIRIIWEAVEIQLLHSRAQIICIEFEIKLLGMIQFTTMSEIELFSAHRSITTSSINVHKFSSVWSAKDSNINFYICTNKTLVIEEY